MAILSVGIDVGYRLHALHNIDDLYHNYVPISLHEGVKFLIRAEVNHAPGS